MGIEMTFAVLSGAGLLAMSIGAFGLLDAYNKRNPGVRRVDWLILAFVAGVVLSMVAYTVTGQWYIAAPLALLLLPADRAVRLRGTFRRRRTADVFVTARNDRD